MLGLIVSHCHVVSAAKHGLVNRHLVSTEGITDSYIHHNVADRRQHRISLHRVLGLRIGDHNLCIQLQLRNQFQKEF